MVNELKQSWGVLIEQANVDEITGLAIVYSSENKSRFDIND
jgi:hypothetical protein